jgi:anti-sigma factor RsiW
MSATTHPVAPEEVMALLDGELSTGDAQVVSSHIEHCLECAHLAEQLRSTSQALSGWKVAAIPPKLANSLTDLVTNTGSRLRVVRATSWKWKQWGIVGGVTALLLLSIALLPFRYPRPAAMRADQVALRAPGFAADSNGTFLALGHQVNKSLSMQSEAISDQQSRVFSSAEATPMIARTVALAIVVKDFAASRASLDTILKRHHGYSAQLGVTTPENAPRSLQASLRIPAPQLASAVGDLKMLGRVENESQSGEEVTHQHTDLVARLKTARTTEQRFREILQQRTGNVAEVLQVEEGIARVRGEIERMEAEQQALERRVDFATIQLQVTEEYKAQLNPPAASVSTRVHNAFAAGYHNASEMVLGVVLFIAEYGPVLLIWIAVVSAVILLWRRYRKALAAV